MNRMTHLARAFSHTLVFFVLAHLASAASAQIVLSEVIIDLDSERGKRADIEIFNDSSDTAYVLAEPFEIVDAGADTERRVPVSNPRLSSMLFTPDRMILEAGQRKLLRIASLGERPEKDRVFRLTVRPVVGETSSDVSGLKLLVGYDVLVLLRAAQIEGGLDWERTEGDLIVSNRSNTAFELFDGQSCSANKNECNKLPSKRIYPGEIWRIEAPIEYRVNFQVAAPGFRGQKSL